MSSDSGRRRARLAVVAAVASLSLAAGCGKKGDPRPAPRTIPQAIADLAVRQRGPEVVLEMKHPQTTAAGLPLPGLDEVVLYELQRPAPPPVPPPAPPLAPAPADPSLAPPPPAAPVPPQPPDPREFAATAKPILRIGGAELASAVTGDRITLRYRLPEPAPAPAPVHTFGVRTHAIDGEASDLSNLVQLVPRVAPEPPAELRVTATKAGVELRWSPGEGALAGTNVYRRSAALTGYGAPLARLDAGVAATVDTSAAYGQRYIYTIAAVAQRDPLVESALSIEREILFEDRFGPAAPARPAALPSAGEVRLIWEAVPEPDVAGYIVERADPGGDFHRVNAEPIAETELTDRGLGSGYTFRYRVAALDRSGNRGDFSTEVEARVP